MIGAIKSGKLNRGRESELHANHPFGRYGPMQSQPVRQTDVQENETVRQLREIFRDFDFDIRRSSIRNYELALDLIENLKYSAKDVEQFSITMTEFQDDRYFPFSAGLFLSALINNGKDTDYTIYTKHLSVKINDLGHKTNKNITINGDAGDGVGGSMKDGKIIVNGNAGHGVGYCMTGGEIHLNGDFKPLIEFKKYGENVKIFHRGKLIFPEKTKS